MSKKHKQVSPFSLEGRFLGFDLEDGYKLKRLRLATAEGEVWIKLTKEARASVGGIILPGDWVQVWGEKVIKDDTEERLKAYRLSVISPRQATTVLPAVATMPDRQKPAAKATILVCQKSDCIKRGGKGVCKALEAALDDRNLGQVTVKGTGCMKHCKSGPTIVFMPDKTRYTHVTPAEIPALIDKHFPASAQMPEITPALEAESVP